MNKTFYTMKLLVWNNAKQAFFSPSRNDFWWDITCREVIGWASNEYCGCPQSVMDAKKINGCTHGIYSSPNPEALVEYTKHHGLIYSGPVVFLMENFGGAEIWTSPGDICNGGGYIVNAFGAQAVAIVNIDARDLSMPKDSVSQAIAIAQVRSGLQVLPLKIAKAMITMTWLKFEGIGFDPYAWENGILISERK